MFGLFTYSVVDEESDYQVKIAQFQRPEVENRGSRFLIVGFLVVCLHRNPWYRLARRASWQVNRRFPIRTLWGPPGDGPATPG